MPPNLASWRDDIDQDWIMPPSNVPLRTVDTTLPVEAGGRPFRIRVSQDLGAFAAVWPRSGHRGDARCHVFQYADVVAHWLSSIGAARGTQPHFVGVFEESGRAVMLLALGIERHRGLKVLSFLDATVSDYNQPVLFPPAAQLDPAEIGAIWRGIVAALPRFDVAVLDKMTEAADDLENPLLHLGAKRMAVSGHATRLEPSRDALDQRMPRKKIRARHRKQLQALGSVAFRVAQTREEARVIMAALIAQKSRQFAETRVPGFEVAGKESFFLNSLDRLNLLEPLHVSALTVDDEIIACHWGLMTEERFYMLMTAHAGEPWRRYSPGALLHDSLMRWSQSRGQTWFDFGFGDEIYKSEYCETALPLYSLEIPIGLAGRAYLAVGSILAALRSTRAWQAARPLKWRLIRALRPRSNHDA